MTSGDTTGAPGVGHDEWAWLDEVDAPRTRQWTADQSARTEAYFAALGVRDQVRHTVSRMANAESGRYQFTQVAAGTAFALKTVPPQPQPLLVRLDDLQDASSEAILLDPGALDESGTTTIDWFRPSPDGSVVAVSLSRSGSEDGYVERVDARTGARIDAADVLHTGIGGSVAWRADGSGVWYTRFRDFATSSDPAYQEVAYHEWGTPVADDRVELAGCFFDDAIVQQNVAASADGRWVLDSAQWGDSGDWEFFVRSQVGGEWWRVCSVEAHAAFAAIQGDRLFVVVLGGDSPTGRVMAVDLVPGATLESGVEVVSPRLPLDAVDASSAFLTGGIQPTSHGTYLRLIEDGVSHLSVVTDDGADPTGVSFDEDTLSISSLTRGPDEGVLFAVDSYSRPREWWTATGTTARRTALRGTLASPLADLDVTRESAVADDGVDVPVTVLRPRGAAPGPLPTLVSAYGAYGISSTPAFRPVAHAWVSLGGVYAVAHVRGGGERGRAWHHAARLTTKRRSVEDLLAAVTHLTASGTATTESIGVVGGSAGGLLVSSFAVLHPEAVAAVAALVPVTDLLNFHRDPNGVFNVPEFGDPEDPAQAAAMRAISPYANLEAGVDYPAMLLTGGDSDARVPSYHAKKLAARMLSLEPRRPVLLRVTGGGHGIGASLDEDVALYTDVLTFFAHELGLTPKDS